MFGDWRDDIAREIAAEESKENPFSIWAREIGFWVGLLLFLVILWVVLWGWLLQ